jgi:5-(carboxyamino)imidazole ribonucleotide synthase
LWQSADPNWQQLLQHPFAKLHLYGKRKARPGRKMGHFTVLDKTVETALEQALEIKKLLNMNTFS